MELRKLVKVSAMLAIAAIMQIEDASWHMLREDIRRSGAKD